jgi:hypothetical protein
MVFRVKNLKHLFERHDIKIVLQVESYLAITNYKELFYYHLEKKYKPYAAAK